MAHVASYDLTPDPQPVAVNDGSATRTYVIANLSADLGCELLGADKVSGDPQPLGQGLPYAASLRVSVDLGPGETLYAAAADAGVSLRVLELRPAS